LYVVVQEGDRIGMMRKSNGNLHYFINGLDQGVAATKVPACVWGVVDLYGMTVKVQNQEAGLSSVLSTVTVMSPGVLSGVACCFHNCLHYVAAGDDS
jgi:hypothetical protein